jgi:hypothetical protein
LLGGNILNEIKLYASACVLGGLLRVIASFLDYNFSAEAIEVLYITTDLCLVLGLIGFYSVYRQSLFWLGHSGFAISICSIAFIAGPETEIFGTSAYQVGSPIIGVGLLLLSINLISAKLCGLVVPISLVASVIIGLISMLVSSSFLFIVTGLLFGVGFMGLGVHIWKNS